MAVNSITRECPVCGHPISVPIPPAEAENVTRNNGAENVTGE